MSVCETVLPVASNGLAQLAAMHQVNRITVFRIEASYGQKVLDSMTKHFEVMAAVEHANSIMQT